MEKITVIVPCYNEQEALHYYYEEMSRVMNEMKEVGFELLMDPKIKHWKLLKNLPLKMKESNISHFQEILEKNQLCMLVLKTVQEIMSA